MQQFYFFLEMLQQLCSGFVLQDLEDRFTLGDFNTLADRVGLLVNNNLNYQWACFKKKKNRGSSNNNLNCFQKGKNKNKKN